MVQAQNTPLIRIVVRGAFDSADLLSTEVSLDDCIRDVKMRLEKAVEIPIAYISLLKQDDVVPLQNHQTITEAGILSDSVLLFIQLRVKHPMRNLMKVCGMECKCFSWRRKSDLASMTGRCSCNISQGITDLHVRHLLHAVDIDENVESEEEQEQEQVSDNPVVKSNLQQCFETAVLQGRESPVRVLASDLRIDVNAYWDYQTYSGSCACCWTIPFVADFGGEPPLIERAANNGRVSTCQILLETGRVDVARAANYAIFIGEHLPYRFPLREMIQQEGWFNISAMNYLELIKTGAVEANVQLLLAQAEQRYDFHASCRTLHPKKTCNERKSLRNGKPQRERRQAIQKRKRKCFFMRCPQHQSCPDKLCAHHHVRTSAVLGSRRCERQPLTFMSSSFGAWGNSRQPPQEICHKLDGALAPEVAFGVRAHKDRRLNRRRVAGKTKMMNVWGSFL